MKIIMVCAILLHPHAGDGYNTTVIRVNKHTPTKCAKAAGKFNAKTGKNVCTCEKVRQWPKKIPNLTPIKEK